MIEIEAVGDVVRVIMSTRWTRAFGYTVSAYLTRGFLIDTGFPDVGGELNAFIERERPAGVLLTHHHEDHAGNLHVIARKGIPITAAQSTFQKLSHGERAGLYRRLIWGVMHPFREDVRTIEPDTLTMVRTPGHSADHHVVWDAERETLFAGDLFLGARVRVARPGEDPRELVRSLRAAAALRPRVMFDAHRGRVTDPVNALNAKADWLEEMVEAMDSRIAAGSSDAAIAREVLGAEDYVGYMSAGDLSRRNFVRAVRATSVSAPR